MLSAGKIKPRHPASMILKWQSANFYVVKENTSPFRECNAYDLLNSRKDLKGPGENINHFRSNVCSFDQWFFFP